MTSLSCRKTVETLVVSLLLLLSYGGKAIAQTPVSVSPEVKADTLQRLERARTFRITPDILTNKNYKGMVRICNDGPKPTDRKDQADACWLLSPELGSNATLEQFMPAFKACALADASTSLACLQLAYTLNRTGHPSYALAVVEFAPMCDSQCRPLENLTDNGLIINFGGNDQAKLVLTNPADVRRVLEKACHTDGSQSGCEMFSRIGGTYNDAERAQAAQDKQNAYEAAMDAGQRRIQSARELNNGGGFLNNLATGLTQIQQEQGLTIENANAQNQANMQATAAAIQERQRQQQAQQQQAQQQQAQQQQQSQRQQTQQQTNVYAPPASPRQTTTTTTASAAAAAPAWSVSGPTTPPTCTVMNSYVVGKPRVNPDGWVSATLTNTSSQALYVSWSSKRTESRLATWEIRRRGHYPGQTVGGEGGGIWSTDADKNPPEIYWYAVLKSDSDAGKSCSTKKW